MPRTRRTTPSLSRAVVVALSLGLSSGVFAAPAAAIPSAQAVVQARALFARGVAAYDAGRFAAALELFRSAYFAAPREMLRYNVAMCLERLGRAEEAAQEYSAYLAGVPGLSSAQRAEVQRRIDQLRSRGATAP